MVALFIDGPLEGQLKEFPLDLPVVETLKMLPLEGLFNRPPDLATPASEIVCYERIATDTDGRRIFRQKR